MWEEGQRKCTLGPRCTGTFFRLPFLLDFPSSRQCVTRRESASPADVNPLQAKQQSFLKSAPRGQFTHCLLGPVCLDGASYYSTVLPQGSNLFNSTADLHDHITASTTPECLSTIKKQTNQKTALVCGQLAHVACWVVRALDSCMVIS